MSETCSEERSIGVAVENVKGELVGQEECLTNLSHNDKDTINHIVYKCCDSNLDWALKYARAGFKVLPINYVMEDGFCSCMGKNHPAKCKKCDKDSLGKHPVGFLATQGVHSATTDEEVIKMWWNKCPNANIGLHAKNFVAMDIDGEKGKESLLKLDVNNEIINPDGSIKIVTPVAKSGRKEYGYHVLFKVPESKGIPNKVKFEPGLDFRSFGGYIVVAPSNHASGNKYIWVKSIFEYELQEMPQWLIDAATSEEVKGKAERKVRKLLATNEKIEKGERNSTLTSLAGSFRNNGLGFNEIRDALLSINKNRCAEPLEASVIETIANSICKYEITNKLSDVTKLKNPVNTLIGAVEKLLTEEKEARLIFDPLGSPFLWLKSEDHFQMIALNENNKAFRKFCFKLVKDKHGLTLKNDETFKKALLAIEVLAEDVTLKKGFDVNSATGYRRTWFNNAAWYDLCSKEWAGIVIDEMGYRKSALPPIFLRRGSENQQIEPVWDAKPEEVNRLFKYANVTDDDKKLLLKAWICASIVPRFRGLNLPQPILSFSGATGSGKTALAKFIKCIIDPSQVEVTTLSKDVDDLSVALNKNGMLVFDNIGCRIPQDISDIFCVATTKGHVTKRKLYTNDEESILRLDSSIIFTSINLGKVNTDLINRTIFIETLKFNKDQKRKKELILIEEFKADLPYILGGIFASISEALKIYSDLENLDIEDESIRMLDFAVFGEALSRVWGNEEMKFFEVYSNMQGDKISEGINESPTLTTLINYMRSTKEYHGPLSDLLVNLKDYYISSGMGKDTTYLISNLNSFSSKLREMDGSLAAMGIEVVKDKAQTKGKYYYSITYSREDTQTSTVQSVIDDSEGW